MSASTYRVAIEATGTDRGASQTMRSIDSSVANAGKSATQAASSFRNLAGAFTAMLVAQKAREGLGALVSGAVDFEFSMKRMKVLTSSYSVDLGKMKQAAISAAEKTTYGPQEAVEALIKLTQATGNADTAAASLNSTLGLAMSSMGKLSPEQAARMAADVIKSFGAEGGTAEEVNARLKRRFDQLYNTTKSMGIEIETFSKIMGRAGQAALISGQDYEEVLLGMTLAARGAPSTLRASNQFMRTQAELVTKGTPIFRKLGIEVEGAGNKIRPYTDMLLDLAKEYEKNPQNVMMALTGGGIKGEKGFGMGAIQPMLSGLNALQKVGFRVGKDYLKGAEALAYLRKERDKYGTIDKAMAESMDSTKGSIEQATEAWENMKRVLGEMLLPTIKWFARESKILLDRLRGFSESPFGKWIGGIIGPLTAVATLLVSIRASAWGLTSILGVTGMNIFGLSRVGAGAAAGVGAAATAATVSKVASAAATTAATAAVSSAMYDLGGRNLLPTPAEAAARSKLLASAAGGFGVAGRAGAVALPGLAAAGLYNLAGRSAMPTPAEVASHMGVLAPAAAVPMPGAKESLLSRAGARASGLAARAGAGIETYGAGFKGHLAIGAIIAGVLGAIKIKGVLDDLGEETKELHRNIARGQSARAKYGTRTLDDMLGKIPKEAQMSKLSSAMLRVIDPLDFLNKGDAARKAMEAATTDVAKEFGVEMDKAMQDALKASLALKDNFTIAGGMLQKSLEDLKDVSKAKTQVIDVKQMNAIVARLESAKFATTGDEMTRRGTVAMGKSITEDLRKLTTTGLTPSEYKSLAQKVSAFAIGAEDISTFHRGTISPAMMKALQAQLVDPTLAGGSMLQAGRTDTLRRLRKDISFISSGAEFLPGSQRAGLSPKQLELESLDPMARERRLERERKDEEEKRKSPVERVLERIDLKMKEQLTKLDCIAVALEDMAGASGPFGFLGLRG